MYNGGIKYVRDIYDVQRQGFCNFQELQYEFGDVGNYLDYMALVANIPREWKDGLKHADNEIDNDMETVRIMNIMQQVKGKVTTKVYDLLVNIDSYDHGRIAWSHELKTEILKEEWHKIRKESYKISLWSKTEIISIQDFV